MRGAILFLLFTSLCLLVFAQEPIHFTRSTMMQKEEHPQDLVSLRVMTYNIRYGKGIDGRINLWEIAQVLRSSQVDIVGLQEVEIFSPRSHFVNQTKWLAEELGFYGIYAPAISLGPYGYGNAILSKYPIESWQIIPVPSVKEPRNFIKAKIHIPGNTITFISTHLGLSQRERLRHGESILEYLEGIEGPVIVVGDWNSTPDSLEVMMMEKVFTDAHRIGGLGLGSTFTHHDQKVRIDYIFTSPLIEILHSETIDSQASDHLPVVAELHIPSPL